MIGPGLGRDPESEGWVLEFLTSLEGPLLIDADALHVAAKDAAAVANRDGATLLTPHPGEAGAMLGWDTPAVTAQRLDAARELAAVFGATVALKGAPTVTQGPEDPPWINATGGSHLGTGGTGDVLAGVIAAFVAQGLSALDAVRLGIHVHGLAGDRLAASRGPAGLRAGQVADVLPETLAFLTERARQPASQTGEAGVVAFPEP